MRAIFLIIALIGVGIATGAYFTDVEGDISRSVSDHSSQPPEEGVRLHQTSDRTNTAAVGAVTAPELEVQTGDAPMQTQDQIVSEATIDP